VAAAGAPRRLRARVRGRVQGVGYRYFAADTARALGLRGFVRNLAEGSVEVVAEGPEAQLDVFRARLAEGPARARVAGVQVSWGPATNEFREFAVRPTSW
jgi:acylphosphatase